ncbi:MAG TPA: hypothetical protein VGK48_14985 [Terriglobia bacterium]
MNPNRFIELLPKIEVIATSRDSVYIAQQRVTGCEACDPTASRPFSGVLDEITKRNEVLTDYFLCEPAQCSRCSAPILESTLVSLGKSDSVPAFELNPPLDEVEVVFVEESMVAEAQQWIGSCEGCSEQAEYSFDQILDSLTGCNPAVTEYILCRTALCPHCRGEVTEKTLVGPL